MATPTEPGLIRRSQPSRQPTASDGQFRKGFLLLLVLATTVAFLWVLQSFLMTILLAAVLSGLFHPLYSEIVHAFKGRRALASAFTILLVLILVVGPLAAITGIVVNQAIRVTESISPVVKRLIEEPGYLGQQLERLPMYERVAPYREQILTRAGEAIGAIGGFLVGSLSQTTRGTVNFIFHFFILLYTMFFLLMDGPRMLSGILAHVPLRGPEKEQMKERFLSMTRATIKGTIVIGIIQGGLSGLAFWLVGIPDALFWTVVMAVLSILPVVGGALIWVPAAIYLVATGEVLRGVVLAGFCSLIVGSVDNVLRPRLVGRDTKMHDLMILFSTLGGIIAFGPVGFIVGPILAGLFVTSWEIFGVAYRDALQERPLITATDLAAEGDSAPPEP
ncbi:MAG TPA: AI-2E family transporter [Vicinamibacterales bacterium]|nr:AI-2E family transporter [Vicinamibacterales bacterium]